MPADKVDAARAAIRADHPGVRIMGAGDAIEIYKEVGCPTDVAERFDLAHMTRHARHRPHAHGDRMRRDDARRASVLDRAGPVPRAQRLAVQPQQPAPRAEARRHDLRDRERHRSRRRLPHVAHEPGHEPRRGAGEEPRRSRRLLHLRRRHQERLRRRARSDRLQAGGHGRDRPVRRLRLGIPRARRPAGHRQRAKIWEPEPATVYFWER